MNTPTRINAIADRPTRVLLVDDEPEFRETLCEEIEEAGYEVEAVGTGTEALQRIATSTFDVVVSDVNLPGASGMQVLSRVRLDNPNAHVIMMTAHGRVDDAVNALKEGAYDYLTKPFELEELLNHLRHIRETQILRDQLVSAQAKLEADRLGGNDNRLTQLEGQSPPIKRVKDMVNMVAASDAPVLVSGESGTGKELVARMIHERSPRAGKPFIAVNCGALAESLIEAELFGHEKGAFTGAVKKRDGRFAAAHGGTLFLDEIGELPLSAQAKLLRVLQEGTFEPVGTNETVKVDVRVVSATHRNLRECIETGEFREDLYYRINVIEIPLPPLRDRPGDLPLLLGLFLKRFVQTGKDVPTLSRAAWAALQEYPFPGNIRELQHALQHAVVLCGNNEIDVGHLPISVTSNIRGRTGQLAAATEASQEMKPLALAVQAFEKEYISRALEQTKGRKAEAANLLGIARKTLWEKTRSN